MKKTYQSELYEERINKKDLSTKLLTERTEDQVYCATTKVVKAILSLSQRVEQASSFDYLDSVRHVGVQLRMLLSSVDTLALTFPPQAHK